VRRNDRRSAEPHRHGISPRGLSDRELLRARPRALAESASAGRPTIRRGAGSFWPSASRPPPPSICSSLSGSPVPGCRSPDRPSACSPRRTSRVRARWSRSPATSSGG
jgi:hypothetical protein